MAAKNYIPSKDADFAHWLANFVTYATANKAALGLTEAQVNAAGALEDGFDAAYQAHLSEVQAAKAKRAAKAAARRAAEDDVRTLVRILQANPAVTDTQRQALGITVPKPHKSPVPAPASRPDPDVRQIEELSHTLRIVDSETHKAAKPDGVDGAEVWFKIVPAGSPAPASPDELAFAGFATTSKFTRDFDGDDAGKTAYYRCRYTNTKGEHGPWGIQVAATIAA